MSDLELEHDNTAERQSNLIATPGNLGPDHLMDFVGNHILEVKPGTTLLQGQDRPGINQVGGILGRGVGNGVGVHGVSTHGHGVRGEGGIGVFGASTNDDGIVGSTNKAGKSGVFGFNTASGAAFGVSGNANSPDGAGKNGFSDVGLGVRGASGKNDGIVGSTNNAGKSGVFGFNIASGAAFGVSGNANSPDGAGINGFSDQGYGGVFRGGRAPLLLIPANTRGRPTTGGHQRGELFVDSDGDLFYCKNGGTPGNWFRIQLTPA